MHEVNTSFTFAYSDGTESDYGQAITSEAISANVIDLDAAGLRIVSSKGPWLIIKSKVTFVGYAIVSLEIQLVNSTAAALTGGTTKQIQIWRFLAAQMTAGALLVNQQLPVGKYLQYLGLNFKPFTSANGGSEIEAYLSDSPETPQDVVDLVVAGS